MGDSIPLLDFGDLEPKQIPVRRRGKEYWLREASEDAARKYRNACVRGARMQDGKVVSIDGVGDVQSVLVAACLTEQGTNRTLTVEELRTWSARHVKQMFDWVKDVSLLDEEPESLEVLGKRLGELQSSMLKGTQEDRSKYAEMLAAAAAKLAEPQPDPNAASSSTSTSS